MKLGAVTKVPAAKAKADKAATEEREKRFRTPVLLKESINQAFLKISRYVHGSSASARKCKTYRTFLILKLLIIKCNTIYL